MPTYKIEGLGLPKPRVVEAPAPASARQHVARDLTVTKIESSEAFRLGADGAKLEVAGVAPLEEEPQDEEQQHGDTDHHLHQSGEES